MDPFDLDDTINTVTIDDLNQSHRIIDALATSTTLRIRVPKYRLKPERYQELIDAFNTLSPTRLASIERLEIVTTIPTPPFVPQPEADKTVLRLRDTTLSIPNAYDPLVVLTSVLRYRTLYIGNLNRSSGGPKVKETRISIGSNEVQTLIAPSEIVLSVESPVPQLCLTTPIDPQDLKKILLPGLTSLRLDHSSESHLRTIVATLPISQIRTMTSLHLDGVIQIKWSASEERHTVYLGCSDNAVTGEGLKLRNTSGKQESKRTRMIQKAKMSSGTRMMDQGDAMNDPKVTSFSLQHPELLRTNGLEHRV